MPRPNQRGLLLASSARSRGGRSLPLESPGSRVWSRAYRRLAGPWRTCSSADCSSQCESSHAGERDQAAQFVRYPRPSCPMCPSTTPCRARFHPGRNPARTASTSYHPGCARSQPLPLGRSSAPDLGAALALLELTALPGRLSIPAKLTAQTITNDARQDGTARATTGTKPPHPIRRPSRTGGWDSQMMAGTTASIK